ncbi:MAG: GntR family transcriptional regulator, partial [Pseudomonadota bacterium]
PGHIQRTLAYFLSLGHYDAQVRRMGKVYAERRQVMARAIDETGLDLAAPGSNGGSSFWMQAPDAINTSDLAEGLQSQSVLIEPGRAFFGPENHNTHFYRLAYSSIPAERIPEGIAKIATALDAR